MLTKTSLKEIGERFVELWDKGDPVIADEIFLPNFIDHDAGPRYSPDMVGHKQSLADFKAAFPDLRVKCEDIVEDENQNKVAVRWTAEGTHEGELMKIPATGKKVMLKGLDIVRIENGTIAERWACWHNWVWFNYRCANWFYFIIVRYAKPWFRP